MSLKSRIEALILQISNAKISLRLLNKKSINNKEPKKLLHPSHVFEM